MTEQELLQYCYFYRGEAIVPIAFEQKHEHALWLAEKFVCENLFNKIERENTKYDIANWVAAYVSKWMPFGFDKIMGTYFKKIPELEASIMQAYS